jgi:hypothetical protein
MFFSFPEDARWNANRQTVEFGVGVGEYEGVVRVPRQVFRRFIDGVVTPPWGHGDARAVPGSLSSPPHPVRADRRAQAAQPAANR